MSKIRVSFWNLQNLFDTTASEIAADLGFTPENGWNDAVYQKKIANLAEVINLMHHGELPDLLGICEIENREVVLELIQHLNRDDYALAHVESPDIRGIDTSLIYSQDVFELVGEPLGHLVHLRYPTRDIFEVPLRVKENQAELTVFVNHWPSRRSGVYETEPFRLTVASYCGTLVDKHLKIGREEFLALPDTAESLDLLNQRWNQNILLMGDFNDEPFSRSMLEYLQASRDTDHLEESIRKSAGKALPSLESYLGKQAFLFNCMWPLLGRTEKGTYYHPPATNTMQILDQFIISRGLYFGLQGLKLDIGSVEVFQPSTMLSGAKKRPKKFEFNQAGIVSDGYSDHFPIQAIIETLPI